MSKLPSLKFRQVRKALEKAGFEVDRVAGSHYIFRSPQSGKIVPVPYHNRDINRGTLRQIIKQAGLTRQEFLELL